MIAVLTPTPPSSNDGRARSNVTAAASSYRWPAEWEAHQATWIAWPHEETDWPGKFEPIKWVYAEIVRVLSESEHVHILVHDSIVEQEASAVLAAAGLDKSRYSLHQAANDRSWLRDSAPIGVKDENGETTWLRWAFNAWAKYDNYMQDESIPAAVVAISGLRSVEPEFAGLPIVLEGGAVDTDGEGTILATEECLLSTVQQRNQSMNREDYEAVFRFWFGAKKTIWLPRGICGDDTHGHIDDLARFVRPGAVVLAVPEDEADQDYETCREAEDVLSAAVDSHGRHLEVIRLPMPRKLYFAGQLLPASYANFYIANNAVLVPTFNDPCDRAALNILADLFPGRKVVGIHSVDLVLGLGTLHCLTQQQPR